MRKQQHHHGTMVGWYLLFGAIHEIAHVSFAWMMGCTDPINFAFETWLGVFLGRQTQLDVESSSACSPYALQLIRHAGWVTSLLLAVVAFLYHRLESPILWAAITTALEGIWTDLLGWSVISAFRFLPKENDALLYCGNFGIILLHDAWFRNSGGLALDVLEKMIQVTMMRGAQSGGVVVFGQNRQGDLVGVRSRVVNKKRTDLSKLLRSKIWWDTFLRAPSPPKIYCGHTRFATSSKASLDGTHPQQWTPATPWKCLDQKSQSFRKIRVENFVTHNGDFDFYKLNGRTYDLDVVQKWLSSVTHTPTPALVDSCAVAGMLDMLRTAGSFALSARYALSMALENSIMKEITNFPDKAAFEQIGAIFENEFLETLQKGSLPTVVEDDFSARKALASKVYESIKGNSILANIQPFVDNDQEKAQLVSFCSATVDAFFDNDLFWSINTFLSNAKGSFGLCFSSSLDSDRQLCLAARGQTISVAFYPEKGLICYGSEQAAVKAGMSVEISSSDPLQASQGDVDNDVLRLDLDDLGGESICLDWGNREHPVSLPNRNLQMFGLMHGKIRAVLRSSKVMVQDDQLYHRMTRLTRNRFIKPLKEDASDPVLSDIQEVPRALKAIQDDWDSKKAATSMNRLTAHTLSVCLRARLDDHVAERATKGIDILLTGCEVSLWLAEQFAADLKKSFPLLRIEAVSSNKLLGLYGQDISIPSVGFGYSPHTHDLHETIVIIVSQSGGTFAPLSCSSLLQSTTKNIFVVTSEWDTQIGKQLRAMDQNDSESIDQLFKSRTFTTDIGLRAAEPCSISVAATHQLLTNLYQYICVTILNDPRYRRVTGSVVSEEDLYILEKCNIENIDALGEIVGRDAYGFPMEHKKNRVEDELRQAGHLWSDHVLENARAYIMTFLYVFGTVTSGYPLAYAIATAFGGVTSNWKYLVHFIDSAIFFWMPQICVIILRLFQGRNLRHRMVGRTVVIADIPWVAQSAEAFLSKLFACSYSIAGLNVHSGNPVDHLVHRHTHRVVRGSLLIAGRPDGRLSALSTAEAAVCLSVNQASSIQSLGGTCESITIGHNPFQLPLSFKGIFLKRKRPMFLCERLLVENDARSSHDDEPTRAKPASLFSRSLALFQRPRSFEIDLSNSRHYDSSIRPRVRVHRSAAALLGAFMNFTTENNNQGNFNQEADDDDDSVSELVETAIRERKWSDKVRKMYRLFDTVRVLF